MLCKSCIVQISPKKHVRKSRIIQTLTLTARIIYNSGLFAPKDIHDELEICFVRCAKLYHISNHSLHLGCCKPYCASD